MATTVSRQDLRELKATCERNDPSRRGNTASDYFVWGYLGRYMLCAIHTRFRSVEWIVTDDRERDELTELPKIIRQAAIVDDALGGLLEVTK